ncbi:hypothetical protein IU486_30865 [Streptomyces gardneri]|nr:hypothetical protein [Streptomyces gardneri]
MALYADLRTFGENGADDGAGAVDQISDRIVGIRYDFLNTVSAETESAISVRETRGLVLSARQRCSPRQNMEVESQRPGFGDDPIPSRALFARTPEQNLVLPHRVGSDRSCGRIPAGVNDAVWVGTCERNDAFHDNARRIEGFEQFAAAHISYRESVYRGLQCLLTVTREIRDELPQLTGCVDDVWIEATKSVMGREGGRPDRAYRAVRFGLR